MVFPLVREVFGAIACLGIRIPFLRERATMAMLVLVNMIGGQTLAFLSQIAPNIVARTDAFFCLCVPVSRRVARLTLSLVIAIGVGSVAFAGFSGSIKDLCFNIANHTFLCFESPTAWEGTRLTNAQVSQETL